MSTTMNDYLGYRTRGRGGKFIADFVHYIGAAEQCSARRDGRSVRAKVQQSAELWKKIGQIEDQLRVRGVSRFRVCWCAPIAVFVVQRGVSSFSRCNVKCQANTITDGCDI
jgi:hypothetical protein